MRWLRGALAVAYPFAIYAGLQGFEPRHVALALAGLVLLRGLAAGRRSAVALRELAVPALCLAAVLAPTLLLNDPFALLFVPAAVNLALLLAFARTLRSGTPLVETLARLQHPELSPAQQRHCRSVTAVWCVFFAANAAVCLGLALFADLWWWTLYTGFLSYLLMALLFCGEALVRWWRFRNYQGSWAEPLARRLFPESSR